MDLEFNMQALKLRLQEKEGDLQHPRGHEVDLYQTLRLQVEDLQKRVEDKDNKLIEANKVIRALRDEVQTLQQQLEQQRRKYHDIIGRRGWLCRCATGNDTMTSVCVEPCVKTETVTPYCHPSGPEPGFSDAGRPHKDQDVTSQSPPPCPPLETNFASRTKVCGIPPNVFLSCTSEDDPADVSVSPGDGTLRSSQELKLPVLSVQLHDCRKILGPDGVFRMETEKYICDEGEGDDDNDDGDYYPCYEDVDYDDDHDYNPESEGLDSASGDGERASEPEESSAECESQQKHYSSPENDETFTKQYSLSADCTTHDEKTSPLKRLSESNAQIKNMTHECTECGEEFPSVRRLRVHQKMHSKDKTGKRKTARGRPRKYKKDTPRECNVCGETFSSRSDLTVHKRLHTGEKPYVCTECGKTYKALSILILHQRMHTQERPYQCSDCPKAFAYLSHFKLHVKRHGEKKDFSCNQCSKRFHTAFEVKLHQRSHSDEKPFLCLLCGRSFKFKGGLLDHETTHTGEKPFPCTHCNKTFRNKQMLKRHTMRHTGEKPYKCADCDKSFVSWSNLRNHKLRHTGERSHLCSVCGKTFARPETLRTHQRVHTGDKPYQCSICEEKFPYPQALQSHQKKEHNIEQVHKCQQCGQSFKSARALKSHDCGQDVNGTTVNREGDEASKEFLDL